MCPSSMIDKLHKFILSCQTMIYTSLNKYGGLKPTSPGRDNLYHKTGPFLNIVVCF